MRLECICNWQTYIAPRMDLTVDNRDGRRAAYATSQFGMVSVAAGSLLTASGFTISENILSSGRRTDQRRMAAGWPLPATSLHIAQPTATSIGWSTSPSGSIEPVISTAEAATGAGH